MLCYITYVILCYITYVGNCDEELPKKPVGRLLVDTRPAVGQQWADCRSTDGRQLTDSRPTGFLGRSSSQLPICYAMVMFVI